ncbi:unnamed protein product [Lupinus luteus]|uniref:t-SNARE coiled-coil homology domain-containing protein n=1 Tax=Lupinus luteus TaxID=3873 RepID=A0AAV1XYC5_LUPLU
MNDLLSTTFPRDQPLPAHHVIEMSSGGGVNLDKFFSDVEVIKEELTELNNLRQRLKSSNEQGKTLHNATAVKDLRSRMDGDVALALKKAKVVKLKLEALDRSNAANRSVPGCGPGSSSDRTRSSVVNGLKKKMKESMDSFNELRQQISMCYNVVVPLFDAGESDTFLQKAIQDQGRGRIVDTINEIQERHDAVKEIEKNLNELHQVFLDMSVLVHFQGEHLDDIESHVARANSFVRTAVQELNTAKKHQNSTRKWTCYAIILILMIILFAVLFVVRPWEHSGSGGSNSNGR